MMVGQGVLGTKSPGELARQKIDVQCSEGNTSSQQRPKKGVLQGRAETGGWQKTTVYQKRNWQTETK